MDREGHCNHVKPEGSRCKAPVLPGKPLCAFHDPDLAAKRAEGRKRGGQVRSRPAAVLPATTPDAALATVSDVAAFLGATVNQVRRGELDPKVGNCLGVLCGQLLKAIEGGEHERRLAALEAALERQQAAGGPDRAGRVNGFAGGSSR